MAGTPVSGDRPTLTNADATAGNDGLGAPQDSSKKSGGDYLTLTGSLFSSASAKITVGGMPCSAASGTDITFDTDTCTVPTGYLCDTKLAETDACKAKTFFPNIATVAAGAKYVCTSAEYATGTTSGNCATFSCDTGYSASLETRPTCASAEDSWSFTETCIVDTCTVPTGYLCNTAATESATYLLVVLRCWLHKNYRLICIWNMLEEKFSGLLLPEATHWLPTGYLCTGNKDASSSASETCATFSYATGYLGALMTRPMCATPDATPDALWTFTLHCSPPHAPKDMPCLRLAISGLQLPSAPGLHPSAHPPQPAPNTLPALQFATPNAQALLLKTTPAPTSLPALQFATPRAQALLLKTWKFPLVWTNLQTGTKEFAAVYFDHARGTDKSANGNKGVRRSGVKNMHAFNKMGHEVTVESAMALLDKAVRAYGQGRWDLSEMCIQPDFLMGIISRLPEEAGGAWDGAVTMDLRSNRLGTLSVEQLRELACALKCRPWLRVRLGHEVMPSVVVKALEAEGMGSAWGGQVCVDRPWENPTNKRLADSIAALADATRGLTAAHERAVKQVKDSTANNRDMSNAWEHQMAAGIKDLVGGEIVAVGYKWLGRSGDLDCLVAGELEGVPVIVIGEAKLNMPSKVNDALTQLASNATRWGDLCFKSRHEGEVEEEEDGEPLVPPQDAKDIRKLRVREFVERKVVYALGGACVPKHTLERIEQQMRVMGQSKWLKVVMPQGTTQFATPRAKGHALPPPGDFWSSTTKRLKPAPISPHAQALLLKTTVVSSLSIYHHQDFRVTGQGGSSTGSVPMDVTAYTTPVIQNNSPAAATATFGSYSYFSFLQTASGTGTITWAVVSPPGAYVSPSTGSSTTLVINTRALSATRTWLRLPGKARCTPYWTQTMWNAAEMLTLAGSSYSVLLGPTELQPGAAGVPIVARAGDHMWVKITAWPIIEAQADS
eukprot:gene23205-30420_t